MVALESPILRIEVMSTSLRMELPMSETNTVSPLRQRMIEDMAARKLNPNTQRGHIYSCKRFAVWLKTLAPIQQLPMMCGISSCTSLRAVPASATAIGS